MTLLWIALLPLLGVLVPLITAQRDRSVCSLATSVVPAAALLLTLLQIPALLDGETLRFHAEWMPELGLELAFRLDGLSLLFNLLIL
ncbi:hypothetical protein, partial [Halomonas sp.]